MELSGNAQRALEQVKRGLFVLYGADYFTEEEWIKIDGLVHKGKYLFTQGPPSNILEEPLMSFEENKDEIKDKDKLQVQAIDTPSQNDLRTTAAAEEQVSSPSSGQADSVRSQTDGSNVTSAETSDEDAYVKNAPTEEAQTVSVLGSLDSNTTTPVSKPAEVEPSANNGLPRGCTQAQLDEIRAFNASLTKAGQKSRPKYEPIEDSLSAYGDEYDPVYNEPPSEEQFYPSPPPTEQEARINTWADGVVEEPQTPQLQTPIPSRVPPKGPAVEVLAEKFIKIHGREPKSINDIYQPNNPNHNPVRPLSRASMRTTRTAASIKSPAKSVAQQMSSGATAPNPGIVMGKVYTAQRGAPRKGIRIEIHAGDHIRLDKYVSGVMYIGMNLRTKECGQFPQDIFKKATGTPDQDVLDGMYSHTTSRRGLDAVENLNAAEWDDVPIIRPMTTAPKSRPVLGGGLAASRFSVLSESPRPSPTSPARNITTDMEKQFEQIINDKVNEIFKARGVAPAATPAMAHRSSRPVKSSLEVVPKTETCWFWSVKKSCRFTAEECRDLHAEIPNRTGPLTNLYQGKPTWGALADSLPSPAPSAQTGLGVIGDGKPINSTKSQGKTCYYWATEGHCSNSAESCKYLHAYTPNGTAPKPPFARPRDTWKKSGCRSEAGDNRDESVVGAEYDGQTDAGGELVLEEVYQGELNGWGQPISRENSWETGGATSFADGKYKPPHIKAMEADADGVSGW